MRHAKYWGLNMQNGLVALAVCLLGLLGCGGVDSASEPEASTQSALNWEDFQRAAGSVQITVNGQPQEWVVVCQAPGGKLRHRYRVGTGAWSKWYDDQQVCSTAPSLAVQRSNRVEIATAYYRAGFHLMEATYFSPTNWVIRDLSTEESGLSTIGSDPIVSYYNPLKGQVSLLATVFPDGELTSIDFYSGAWHRSRVSTWPGNGIWPFFSQSTGTTSYFSVQLGGTDRVIYRRTAPGNAWRVVNTVTTPGVVGFGGADESCRSSGCIMQQTQDSTVGYGAIVGGTINDHSFIFSRRIANTPMTRWGGDPNYAYGLGVDLHGVNGVLVGLGIIDGGTLAAASKPPTSQPTLVGNVYAGSVYERDAFFTQAGTNGDDLYRIYYEPTLQRLLFEDMGITVYTSGSAI